MSNIKGEGLEEAQRVIRAAYYKSVRDDAADLIRAYFDGEYDDAEGRDDRIHETSDSHVTYTYDQWTTLYASENVGAGMERAEEYGYTQPQENPGGRHGGNAGVDQDRLVAVWAIGAYEADLYDLIHNQHGATAELVDPILNEHLDSDARLLWLVGHHTTRYLVQTEDGSHAFLIGTKHVGGTSEVSLGVVVVSIIKGAVRASRESTKHFFDSLFPDNRAPIEVLQFAQLVADGDMGAWAPLSDLMQEAHGRILGLEPMFVSDDDEPLGLEPMLVGDDQASLREVIAANYLDDDVTEPALVAKVGDEWAVGGGAQARFRWKRVR